MTREEILAMKPGRDLDFLYARHVENWTPVPDIKRDYPECAWIDPGGRKWSHIAVPRFSTNKIHLLRMLNSRGPGNKWRDIGLFTAPLNNGQWACGRANKIYDIKIMDDHGRDKELVICDTPMEAALKMRLILALCPEEANKAQKVPSEGCEVWSVCEPDCPGIGPGCPINRKITLKEVPTNG
jgi:hypothetical protein